MDLGIAFLLGLVGSLHCAAMCGPLMVALPVTQGKVARFLTARVVYQLGRIATYCLMGIIAGLAGRSLMLAGFQQWISIGAGVAIILGFLVLKKRSASAPIHRLVTKLKSAMAIQLHRRTLGSNAMLGMLNGLLPCGLVYVAAAGAVSRGTVLSGIGWMAAFGLGTTPMMLGISLSGKLVPPSARVKLQRAIPVGVFMLATLLILRGLSLGIPYLSPDLASATPGCCHTP